METDNRRVKTSESRANARALSRAVSRAVSQMSIRWGVLWGVLGLFLLFAGGHAQAGQNVGSPQPVAYRYSTPADAVQLGPSSLNEIRYQIRLYRVLEIIAREMELELNTQEINDAVGDLEESVAEGSLDLPPLNQLNQVDQTGISEPGDPRIELEFQVLPDRASH